MPDYIPFVSIVIATSNRADSLVRTLDSLLHVNYPSDKLEILVIDDGSTDHTPEAVKALTESFQPAPLLCHSLPKGNITHARNRGAKEAIGEVVVFTDDDCTFEPDWLRTLVQPLQDTQIGAVGGGDCAPPDLAPFEAAVDHAFCSLLGVGGVRHGGSGHRAARYVPRGCNMAARREVILEAGGFDTRFFNGEEIDLDYRIEKAGYRLVFQDHCTVQHHRRATWPGLHRQVSGRGRTRHMLFQKHPECFELAYLAPSIALGVLSLVLLLSVFSELARLTLGMGLIAYITILLLGGLHAFVRGLGFAAAIRVPPILALMHFSYGAGYWRGILGGARTCATESHALRCLISNDGFGPNQGDRAILEVMQTDLQEEFPGVEIRGFLNAWVPTPPDLLQFWHDLRWADVFLFGGGQVIHDQTCLLFLAAGMLKLLAARLAGTPFVCYGVGVGPLHSRLGRRAVRAMLSRAALILVRDEASKRLLIEIGVEPTRVTVTADVAFRLPPLTGPEADDLLHSLGLEDATAPRVAICPRRWFHYRHGVLPARWRWPQHSPAKDDGFSALADTLAMVADAIHSRGGTVLLVPMKTSTSAKDPGQDDDVVCRQVRDRMADLSRTILVPAVDSPRAVATLLAQMDCVVTMRMHAAILGAGQGVPAIGLSLSEKFDDCFARLDQGDRLIPVAEANRDGILACVDAALATGPEARAALRERAAQLADLAENNIKLFAEWASTQIDCREGSRT